MPIPSYPENRREEYLNNIATGSGEIPPYPENREEQYLDAIARNGGGASGGVLVVHAILVEDENAKKGDTKAIGKETYRLDKTWQEIHDADLTVLMLTNQEDESFEIGYYFPAAIYYYDGDPEPYGITFAELESFTCVSANDYPTASM